MQHQILGLRDFTTKSGETKKRDAFYEKNWGVPRLEDIFKDSKSVLAKIPDDEHYNLYFTVAECDGKREFRRQKFIPFDIDDIDTTRAKETVGCALTAMGLEFSNVYSSFSGHGVQFFIELEEAFEDPNYFDENRDFYKAVCEKIDKALKEAGLKGHADSSVFSLARLMRMLGTWNIKPGKPKVMAEALNGHSVAIPFSLRDVAGVPKLSKEEVLAKWPPPDTEAVLSGCENIKKMVSDADNIPEPLWYALASVIGRLGASPADGRSHWHELSKHYSKYDSREADRKLEQAVAASGPRTCQNFSTLPGSVCDTCPHFKKIRSPILIQGPNYIRTKEWGFHERSTDSDGKPSLGKPNFDDLLKWFERQHPYVVNEESEQVFVFSGSHYTPFSKAKIKAFAEKWFQTCNSNKAHEFYSKIIRTNLVSAKWFDDSTHSKMNFLNGVLDIDTMVFTPKHSKELGFMHVIPYNYDPLAQASRFDRFMDEVTRNDKDLKQQLLEFAGYCLSNDDCWEHKALVLVGHGSNGKSVFMETLMSVAETGYSVVSMRDIQNAQFAAGLEGKLFNVAEESASSVFKDTDIFKALVSGGKLHVKTVYQKPYEIRNRAKLVFSCNEIPSSYDGSHGFFRRFSIAPFDAVFDNSTRDPHLIKKLTSERAGILNMMLDAYKDMKIRGHLMESESGKVELAHYKENTDELGTWFKENAVIHTELAGEIRVLTAELYTSYREHCIEGGNNNPMTMGKFHSRIRKLIPNYDQRRSKTRVNGQEVRILYGISLIGKEQI